VGRLCLTLLVVAGCGRYGYEGVGGSTGSNGPAGDAGVGTVVGATEGVLWYGSFPHAHFTDELNAVAVDANGNYFFMGDGFGFDFGGGMLSGAGRSVYTASFDSFGVYRESRSLGGAGTDYSHAIRAFNGNILKCGQAEDVANFGGSDLGLGKWGFLASHADLSYEHRFSVATTPNVSWCQDVRTTPTAIYTVSMQNSASSWTLTSWSESGASTWSTTYPGWNPSLAVDDAGNSYVGGMFSGTINLGGVDLVSAGNNDAFLASYDSSGAHRWSTRMGDVNADRITALEIGDAGNIIVAGLTPDATDAFGATLVHPNTSEMFLASVDADAGLGHWALAMNVPTVNGESISAIARDPDSETIYFNHGTVLDGWRLYQVGADGSGLTMVPVLYEGADVSDSVHAIDIAVRDSVLYVAGSLEQPDGFEVFGFVLRP